MSNAKVYDEAENGDKEGGTRRSKLVDLGELMPHSSSGHLVFERVVALERNELAAETSGLTVLALVDSVNNRYKGSLALIST